MIPFRFGRAERPLFGVFHPGNSAHRASFGVLLCNPFGQEAIRTHRMYRVLAERLAGAGLPALRFDYYATGESAGDDEDGDLDGWCRDVVTAHEELLQRSRCARVAWVGTRLGGTLAALASACAERAPDRLVLREPIVAGRRYRDELVANHAKALTTSYSLVPLDMPASSTHEAIGFAMSATLVEQLDALSDASLAGARAGEVVLIANGPDAQCERLKQHYDANRLPTRSIMFKHNFEWTSQEAMNTALVPSAALELLTAQIAEV
jgi:hypothetical protein